MSLIVSILLGVGVYWGIGQAHLSVGMLHFALAVACGAFFFQMVKD